MNGAHPFTQVDGLKGSAVSALVWVFYDTLLVWDRELQTVWKSSWTVSKALYLFLRYHSLIALGWYCMMAVGNTPFAIHMTLPPGTDSDEAILAPCIATHDLQLAGRWYIALTEVTTILLGEALILIRINALYGWSRSLIWFTLFLFFAEAAVGYSTSIITLLGGARGLPDSSNVADCSANALNVPDVNLAMWSTSILVALIYFLLIVRKSALFAQEGLIQYQNPSNRVIVAGAKIRHAWSTLASVFSSSEIRMAPTLHLCLRDAAIYFLVVGAVLILNMLFTSRFQEFALLGTPWLISTYCIASTRIFLNLKASGKHGRVHGFESFCNQDESWHLDATQVRFRGYPVVAL